MVAANLSCNFKNCDYIYMCVYNTKFTILTIFKCAVQWHSHCCTTTLHLQNSFSPCKTETLSLKHWLWSPYPQPLATNILSVSMNWTILGASYDWNHTVFAFLWLAYFTGIMSSRFTHAVACVWLTFLLRLNNIPLYRYTTFCLSMYPPVDICVASLEI